MALLRGKKKNAKSTKVEEKATEVLVEGIGSDEEVAEGIQTTFNTDGLDVLVVEGEVENVEVHNED